MRRSTIGSIVVLGLFVWAVGVYAEVPDMFVSDPAIAETRGCVVLTEAEQACLAEINAVRVRSGLPKFKVCSVLTQESRAWSAYLAERQVLYHGATAEICAKRTNCGVQAFRIWNHSPPHRAFFFSRADHVGIGVAEGYWTMRAENRQITREVDRGTGRSRSVERSVSVEESERVMERNVEVSRNRNVQRAREVRPLFRFVR